MSSEIKNNLLNCQKYLIVGETSPSSTKVVEDMRNKYQKKIDQPSSCDWEVLNTLTEDEWSSGFIYQLRIIHSEGLKALKTTGNGNCLYNSTSVLNQGDESANLVLRISVKNALHNKWVICKQFWQHFKLNLLTAFVNDNFWYINLLI